MKKFIRIQSIKIALLVQSVVTTCAVIYMMFQTSALDDSAMLEIQFHDKRCRGCCVVQNETMRAISNEPRLSEKLHKFSRAIRNYEIPKDVMKILHDAERAIEQFERELKKYKEHKLDRWAELHKQLIEEETGDVFVSKSKPKWQAPPKPVLKVEGVKIPNDVHNEVKLKIPA